MDTTPRSALRSGLLEGPARRVPLARSVAWIGGLLAAAAAVAVGAVLAVFAAAAMTVIAVSAAMLFFLTSLAYRARRAAETRQPILEARKVGHAWVTYGWDRPAR
jgi:hypothetical protein